jgi:hypothetical protein
VPKVKKKNNFKSRDNAAYKQAGKLGGNKEQMSSNYNKIKDGKKPIDYNLPFYKRGFLGLFFNSTDSPNISQKEYKQYPRYEPRMPIQYSTVEKTITIVKTAKYVVESTKALPGYIKNAAEKVAKSMVYHISEILLGSYFATVYYYVKLTIVAGKVVVSLYNTYNSIKEVIKVFQVRNGIFESLNEKYDSIVDSVKQIKDLNSGLKELSLLV